MASELARDPSPEVSAERRTRDRVLRLLLEGPTTASALGERLELSPAAVRRHLDALLASGAVAAVLPRNAGPRGRGRPARLFALTDAGHAAMSTAYDDLAASALRFLADSAGAAAVTAFAQERVAALEQRVSEAVRNADDPVAALADALSVEGYAASARSATAGMQLCQHHCPVQAVAAQFPQLCEAETEVFARLLGTHVQRLATLAHGDGVCTTFVPAAPPSGGSPAAVQSTASPAPSSVSERTSE